jgi:DNA-binding MarR family transcriptional regulator
MSKRTNGLKASSDVQEEDGSSAIVQDVAKILVFRHLIRNLESERKERDAREKKQAPRIKGPRSAAVLARLWCSDELSLAPVPQKVIARELGMRDSEVTKAFKELRREKQGSKPCVELVSDNFRRERVYKITRFGKEELERWIVASYGHTSFLDTLIRKPPGPEYVDGVLASLKEEVEKALR